MFRPVNRSSSGLQQNKSKVLLRNWGPNVFLVVNKYKIWYWIKCDTYIICFNYFKQIIYVSYFIQYQILYLFTTKKNWDSNFLTESLTYSAEGLMMTC